MSSQSKTTSVAVIGLACRYPDARTPREFWENILARRRAFRRLPQCRLSLGDYVDPNRQAPDTTYAQRAAVIDGFEFDWSARRIPKTTVQSTDIVHWLALETALAAIEDAGFDQADLPGETTGVIIGNTLTGEQTRSATMRLRWPYVKRTLEKAAVDADLDENRMLVLASAMQVRYKAAFPQMTEDSLAGGLANTIAGRICHYLDVQGGGYTVDGACSSSLLAVTTGVERLVSGDLDLAVIGGVDVSLDPFELVGFAKTGALSSGDMNVYDRRGQGFIPGEGCGFMVLKRLDDARRDGDMVYAVINGWGISSDGRGTGITAPTVRGQVIALKRAYARCSFDPSDLDFIEGHGTGTAVGDPVELKAIHTVLSADNGAKPKFCGVTSLKSIIGHTKAASGIGGLIKAVMAVNRRVVPPLAGCREPHPLFEKELPTIYPVLHGRCRSADTDLHAGVSSMGFGGINCHITLCSGDRPSDRLAPSIAENALLASSQSAELFVLGGHSAEEIAERASELSRIVEGISVAELTDLAAHLAGKISGQEPWRAALIASEPDNLSRRLSLLAEHIHKGETQVDINDQMIWMARKPSSPPRVGMLFPGQGSQQLNMARVLIQRFQWAQDMLSRAENHVGVVDGLTLEHYLFRDHERSPNGRRVAEYDQALARTRIAQPAICLASALWLTFLKTIGITPDAVGGHSLGEITALYAAGAIDLDVLFACAALRGRLMDACEQGAMAALGCGPDTAGDIIDQVDGYVTTANFNAADQTVISGEVAAVEAALALARAQQVPCRRLAVSGAFHSRLMTDAAEKIRNASFLPKDINNLDCRLYSTLDGKAFGVGRELGEYLSRQMVSPVDFIAMVRSLSADIDLMMEVGPGRILTGLADTNLLQRKTSCLPVEAVAEEWDGVNRLLAAAFIHGADIHWPKLYKNRLVRDFLMPAEKRFIANMCETDVEPAEGIPVAHRDPSRSEYHPELGRLTGLPETTINAYLQKRGNFLAQVIRADLGEAPVNAGNAPVLHNAAESGASMPEPPRADQGGESPSSLKNGDLSGQMKALVSDMTGFSAQTISMQSRLLDDLNLDSIKAGDLLVKMAQLAGVKWPDDPGVMANARLAEIGAALKQLQQHQLNTTLPVTPGNDDHDVTRIVMAVLSEMTGFNAESLSEAMRLVDDLNLDSIKIGDLVSRSAREVNVAIDSQSVKTPMTTVADVIALIEPGLNRHDTPDQAHHSGGAVSSADRSESIPAPHWVRNFKLEWTMFHPKLVIDRPYWSNIKVLVLHGSSSAAVAEAIQDHLEQYGATATCRSFQWAVKAQPVELGAFSHRIAVMPIEKMDLDAVGHKLPQMATQRAVLAQSMSHAHCTAFVQFGGGRFGRTPETADLFIAGCAALAAGLHHEFPRQKVCVVDMPSQWSPRQAADTVLAEISAGEKEGFSAAGYDDQGRRWCWQPELSLPVTYQPRPIRYRAGDVILVTGGAKGITAECALVAAQASGAQLALIGTTPAAQSDEIQANLIRMRDIGIQVRYYSCDITRPRAVTKTIAKIRHKQGPVKAVIHGAGLNRPRPAANVTAKEAVAEISPKVLGFLNIWSALKDAPPKLVMGLSSIIGITGMPGNAWYGFANEALDIVFQTVEARYPQTRTQSVAFSIWRDTGMGARMGSVTRLAQMGIDAIPNDEGCRRFGRLFTHDPGTPVVIVAARLGGLDTWNPVVSEGIDKGRFCDRTLVLNPGIEAVFNVHLDLKRDLYLRDHLFQGSYLFPTVFGLEAMTQAAMAASGRTDFSGVRLENIELKRPITVDPKEGADLVVWAQVDEPVENGGPVRIRTGIRKENTGASADHFSATVIFDASDQIPIPVLIPELTALALEPESDLYRPTLLFQGRRFQRIEQVLSLEGNNHDKGCGWLEVRRSPADQSAASAFDPKVRHALVLPDPFFTDAMLQSAALLVPQDTSLPVAIDRIDFYPNTLNRDGRLRVRVDLENRVDQTFHTHVVAVDDDGLPMVRMEGYRLRILKHVDTYPTLNDLKNPRQRDKRIISKALEHAAGKFQVDLPETDLAYIPGIHTLPKTLRHQAEMLLLEDMIADAINRGDIDADHVKVRWLENGKPVIDQEAAESSKDISLSHDYRMCLAVLGSGPQGCDLAPVSPRSHEAWLDLLGRSRNVLLDRLIDEGDSLDEAGTRIWSACEAAMKAIGIHTRVDLEYIERSDKDVLFSAVGDNQQKVLVLTLEIHFTWGVPKILAEVVTGSEVRQPPAEPIPAPCTAPSYPPAFAGMCRKPAYEVLPAGPNGELIFLQRFPVTFKPSAQLSRHVYFTHFFDWMGHAREASTWPIMQDMIKLLSTGKWGSVTNYSRLQVFGEVRTGDLIRLRMWTSDNSGPQSGTMTLQYEFVQLLPDGGKRLLALSELQTTWVALTGPGMAKPAPYPDVLKTFFNDMIPRDKALQPETELPSTLGLWHNPPDDPIYQAENGPVIHPQLAVETFETSLGQANAVGNVYYANYYEWQGAMRDHYLQRLLPDHFGGVGELGEAICLDCRVDHLREAMPFDQIMVTMALKTMHASRAVLQFDYYRMDDEGAPVKLAWGSQQMVWVQRDSQGQPRETPFPDALRRALLEAIHQDPHIAVDAVFSGPQKPVPDALAG
jgi:acyl transferase domain-containing protein/NAD(P)-dependent dehydrogenase (short-subunit alcohol dehydrogenase family)/acyl-CoA thioesterase FadM/phosphopantetheinyl transferase